MVSALEQLMIRAGVEVRTGCTVSRIRMRDGRAAGVDLEDGSEIAANIIIANADAPQVPHGLAA